MSRIIPWAVAVLLCSGAAAGQATQPHQGNWASAMEHFASVLKAGDPLALARLLAENVTLSAWDAKAADASGLLERTKGGSLIMTRAYAGVPSTLAEDVARAIGSSDLPEAVKSFMIPEDEAQIKQANATAAKWVAESLSAAPGDPTGAALLWVEPTEQQPTDSGPGELIFVLVKATAEPGEPKICNIVFGNAQRPVR